MAASPKLAQLVRDAKAGLSDTDVLMHTGLSFSTWRRLLIGIVPGDDKLLAFAVGMGVDPQPFIDAATEARQRSPGFDAARMIATALTRAGISQAGKFKILSLYREVLAAEKESAENEG